MNDFEERLYQAGGEYLRDIIAERPDWAAEPSGSVKMTFKVEPNEDNRWEGMTAFGGSLSWELHGTYNSKTEAIIALSDEIAYQLTHSGE